MRRSLDLAAFDPHPAFRLYRGFRRKHRPLRLALPSEARRGLPDTSAADDTGAPNNPEPR